MSHFKIGGFVSLSKSAILSRFQNRLFCLTLKSAVLSRIPSQHQDNFALALPFGRICDVSKEKIEAKDGTSWNNLTLPLDSDAEMWGLWANVVDCSLGVETMVDSDRWINAWVKAFRVETRINQSLNEKTNPAVVFLSLFRVNAANEVADFHTQGLECWYSFLVGFNCINWQSWELDYVSSICCRIKPFHVTTEGVQELVLDSKNPQVSYCEKIETHLLFFKIRPANHFFRLWKNPESPRMLGN